MILYCQVCNHQIDPHGNAKDAEQMARWEIQQVELSVGILQFLTCPDCRHLDREALLAGYKKRIASGLDVNYH